MRMMKVITGIALLLWFSACGSSGGGAATGITIKSLVDGNAASVATTGTTGVLPTQFTVEFSSAVTPANVNATNITMSCTDGALAATLSFTEVSTTTYLITPASPSTYYNLTCVMNFTTGTGLAANATYTFANGAGPSGPTVSTLVDGKSAAIETTGTTDVFPTLFTVTFSEAVDPTTVTTDNITMECADVPVNNLTIEASDDTNTTFTVTPPNSYGFSLLSCDLAFGAGIKNAAGTDALTAVTYTFVNDCSTTDVFANSATINFSDPQVDGCWTIYGNNTPAKADAALSYVTDTGIDLLGYGLQFAPQGADFSPEPTNLVLNIYKLFSKDDTDYVIDQYFGAFTNPTSDTAVAAILLGPIDDDGTFTGGNFMFVYNSPLAGKCGMFGYGYTPELQDDCTFGPNSALRLTRAGNVFTAAYDVDGSGTYVNLAPYTDTDGTITNSGSAGVGIGFLFASDTTDVNFVSTMGTISFDGVTAIGQY